MEKRTIKVVCAIIRKEDKILCTQRLRKGPTYIAEHWEFPGGKVKSNENDYDALRREIKEEMDWDIDVGKQLGSITYEYPDFNIILTAYDCRAHDYNFKLFVHLNAKWLNSSEFDSLEWTAADKKTYKDDMEIIVGKEIENVCPNFVGACVEAKVKNSNFSQELWKDIDTLGEEFRNKLTVDTLKDISGIAATRHIYRICGKDPSRYRPASEALIRRILQGKALYQINTLVDLINLASMKYGYSIGGFDADKIIGDTLKLGIGKEGEPYKGIGRGTINIQGLPVYRDDFGGVGTPTSDNERTKITINTTHLLVLINGYDGNEELVKQNAEYIQQLLKRFCESNGGSFFIYK